MVKSIFILQIKFRSIFWNSVFLIKFGKKCSFTDTLTFSNHCYLVMFGIYMVKVEVFWMYLKNFWKICPTFWKREEKSKRTSLFYAIVCFILWILIVEIYFLFFLFMKNILMASISTFNVFSQFAIIMKLYKWKAR